MTATPNHALQGTGSAVTAPAADHLHLSTHRQVPRPLRLSLSLGSFGATFAIMRSPLTFVVTFLASGLVWAAEEQSYIEPVIERSDGIEKQFLSRLGTDEKATKLLQHLGIIQRKDIEKVLVPLPEGPQIGETDNGWSLAVNYRENLKWYAALSFPDQQRFVLIFAPPRPPYHGKAPLRFTVVLADAALHPILWFAAADGHAFKSASISKFKESGKFELVTRSHHEGSESLHVLRFLVTGDSIESFAPEGHFQEYVPE